LPRLTRSGAAPALGIVHFGPGAFFRAHLAQYTHDAMAHAGGDWGIDAVSLKSPRAADQLNPQGGMYTAVELGPEGRKARQLSAVRGCIQASRAPERVIARIADPATRIISLTITEKGYGHAGGALDPGHPDIAHDLAHPPAPRSAMGLILAGLAARRRAGLGGLTVLSCDNLMQNGTVTRAVLVGLARELAPELVPWIEAELRFPSTMVDRITPATAPDDLARLDAETGVHDAAAVFHEPFSQWVIEDDFAAGRPVWDAVGADLVRDVAGYERMKLRCLNGTHSALAYLGAMAGHQTIAEAVADPVFAALCEKLWAEDILPTVPAPEGADLAAYCRALMQRYQNPAIQHRTHQIAMDGSQKLPPRILAPLSEHLAQGHVPGGFALVLAGWMHYAGGVDELGGSFDVADPMVEAMRRAHARSATAEARVAAFLGLTTIFPPAMAAHPGLVAAITAAYHQIAAQGVRPAIRAWLG